MVSILVGFVYKLELRLVEIRIYIYKFEFPVWKFEFIYI